MHHVGSAHTSEALDDLVLLAEGWIKDYSTQLSIFPDEIPNKAIAPESLYIPGCSSIQLLQQSNNCPSR